MKQVIVVRKDLKMGCGKIAGQVAHASVTAYKKQNWFKRRQWFKNDNQVKVVLKVKSEQELIDIMYECMLAGIKYSEIHDAGRTQIEPNTLTAVGIGPDSDEKINKIVKDLKLL